MKKLTLLAGVAVGYVLGSRAGRERFEQIRASARRVAANPKVQSAATRAQETVAAQAPVVAEAVREKVTSAASVAAEKMHRGEHPDETTVPPDPSAASTGPTAVPPVEHPTVRP